MRRLYTGQFKSIQKDKLYTVQLDCSSHTDVPVPITLGPSPFTTTMDGGSNTIYNPVKYQSATVQVVADEYYFDFYASYPTQNTVKLIDPSSNVVFTGYISPCVFDAPYNFVTESWDVECVDGLSTLKNFDYTPADSSARGFISFAKLIHNCLFKCGCYNHFFISKALRISDMDSSGGFKTYDNMFISEANFFDEDDNPMKVNEVLEEVCKFIGVSAVAEGEDVYFMDYDAIKAGTNTYWRYDISTNIIGIDASYTTSSTSISRSKALTISKDSYSSTGARLSMDSVYSKVTVRDSLYAVGSIIPSMFEDEDLVNAYYVDEDNQNWNYTLDASCMDRGEKKKKDDDDTWFEIRKQYYTNKKYNHFYAATHLHIGNQRESIPGAGNSPIKEDTQYGTTGVSFAKFNIGSGKNDQEALANLEFDSFENYLMMPINYDPYIDCSTRDGVTPTAYGFKRLETKGDYTKPFFMSADTNIIVKGELILVDRGVFPKDKDNNNVDTGYWPCTSTFHSVIEGTLTEIVIGNIHIPIWSSGRTMTMAKNKLKLGVGLTLKNGSTTYYNRIFDVPFCPIYSLDHDDDVIHENKDQHEIYYTGHAIQNNVNYNDKIKEKGYKLRTATSFIPGTVLPATPIISIYGMVPMLQKEIVNINTLFGATLGCIFIKDFDVVAVNSFEGGDESVNATDTEYTVVIDDDYTTELSPITFKICTSDGKTLNYSSVAWKNDTTWKFVDNLTHSSLKTLIESAGESSGKKRAEELMCFRIVNQYAKPSKKLTINLFDDLVKPWSYITEPNQAPDGTKLTGCNFIINTMSHDYVTDTISCELIEKK